MDSDEREIRELVAAWMSATKSGDLSKVLSLMSDDVVFLRPGHAPMRGKSAFAEASKPPPGKPAPKFAGTSEIQEIEVRGDWAFMWVKLTVAATMPDGQALQRAGHTLSILKKENGRWLLARDANMLAPVSS